MTRRGPTDRDDVPRVHVRCPEETDVEWVDHVEHGLEEEGVPWVVRPADVTTADAATSDVVTLAHEAATDSPLKIGVAVHSTRIVVHHARLAITDPVYDVASVDAPLARTLGTNAARLAKGTPLRPVD